MRLLRHFFYWSLFVCFISGIFAELPNLKALESQKEGLRVNGKVLVLGDMVTELDLSYIYRIQGSPNLALKLPKISIEEEDGARTEHAPIAEEESALKDAGYLKHSFEYQNHRIHQISLIHGDLLIDIVDELSPNEIKTLNKAMKNELKRLHELGISSINIDLDSVLCHFQSGQVTVQFLDFEMAVLYYDDEAGKADFDGSVNDDEKQLRRLMKKAYKRAKKDVKKKLKKKKTPQELLRDYNGILSRVMAKGISANGKLYRFGKELGNGSDGIVYFAQDNPKVLLKVVRFYKQKDKKDTNERPEIDIELIGLKASKKLIYHYEEGPLNVIIYKFTPGYRLTDLVSQKKIPGDLSKPSVQKLFLKAGHDAISRIHKMNIHHGDTHMLNILFTISERGQVGAEVIDFSRSTILKSASKAEKIRRFRNDHEYFNTKFKDALQKWYQNKKLKNPPNFNHPYFAVYNDV